MVVRRDYKGKAFAMVVSRQTSEINLMYTYNGSFVIIMEGDVGVVCPLQLSRVQSTGPSLCCSQVAQPQGAAVMCKVIRLT